MALDWSQCPEVTRSPDVMSGEWVFKDTRLPVATVLEDLEGGILVSAIPNLYPGVEIEQIHAVLRFLGDSLELTAEERSQTTPAPVEPGLIDWSRCDVITRHRDWLSGAWRFKGTRIFASTVFGYLEDDYSYEDIEESFPGLSRDAMRGIVRFAADSLVQPMLVAEAS